MLSTNSKKALLYSQLLFNNTTIFSISASSSSAAALLSHLNLNSPTHQQFFFSCYYSTSHAHVIPIQQLSFNPSFNAKDIVQSFKEWLQLRHTDYLDRIFEILSAQDKVDEGALSQLGLHLTESLVLDVLYYGNGKNDFLSCLKFFDWAGRQPGFYHTRSTFHAIFKILSKAKLTRLLMDFLDNYMVFAFLNNKLAFYSTLVIGYSVTGKPQVALQVFGKMRFLGFDLDYFGYHILLNSLVEESCFDAVGCISRQISLRGFESHVTHCIVVKSLCKQKLLDEAKSHLRRVILLGDGTRLGDAVGVLVGALCQNDCFDEAGLVVEEFRELGVPMEPAYNVWQRNLVQAGKIDAALEFLKRKKSLECYVPEVFQYNALLWRLLKENRLTEACDLLMEMMEGGVSADKVTLNAALCFFCKAGMVDVALDLCNSKSEFGFSASSMACNYLINSLCREGKIDEAYNVWRRNYTEQGYFPGRRTFYILADALCREGKLDIMIQLVLAALERNFIPSDSLYSKFISALCRARRPEDGYLILVELNKMNRVAPKTTYSNLIHGFKELKKGDIAARLLIEMQNKGHMATRTLFRAVICSLCDLEKPETQFFKLLEMQLSCHEPNCKIYNFFIDGAGHAKKPELAREVFEMMQRSGIEPNMNSDILMLQSYLKNKRISDALNFFDALRQRRKIGSNLYSTMVVGLCKVNEMNHALYFLGEFQSNGAFPSGECYEELIKLLCSNKEYKRVVHLIIDLEKAGRRVTSFIGNTLLLHSLRSEELYDAWIQVRDVQNFPSLSVLGQLIGAFSGRVQLSQKINWELVIERCFPLKLYTYNMLLRRIIMDKMDDACELFDRLYQKGYEPNKWTCDILAHGLRKHGRTNEARRLTKMFKHFPRTK
ncbi:hypothetical protein P3X46_028877 [Hevea brasiliensis]|uniref:Pentacotripeptide-repeat region of PRORP domain-containing protein n=1 Tax=Hevea brasiliensis TaxID=3981 RepID=A0ABQ9KRV4_HEVBR|nr:pentatricopeptide repeat-containing protein At1g71210, mitochondrial-like [Hevea brasiliensis]KAJ9146639.1 hypothetical protein P3X46_028877 [Hevea brasiliensis]